MIRTVAFLALTMGAADASQVHPLNEQQEIQVNVSHTELNRITVENDRISDVFTHGSHLEILADERIGQIFVKAHSSSQEGMRITLTTEDGRVQDMRLRAQSIQGQTIILTEHQQVETKGAKKNNTLREELVTCLSEFSAGETPPGFKLCESCEENQAYHSDQYTVEVLTHTNTSEETVHLNETLFVSHPNIVAILIDCPVLECGDSTQIWRVSLHD